MKMIPFISIVCAVAFLAACADSSREYILTGKLGNCTSRYALLHSSDTTDMDTIPIAADGTFYYAKQLGAPFMSYMMVEKGGFFPLILINGTENRLEADLSTPGQYHFTGDLEEAYTFYQKHLQAFSQLMEQEGSSFKALQTAYEDYRKTAMAELAKLPDKGFHQLYRETLEKQIFSNLVTYWSQWRGKGQPVSADTDFNHFMDTCDLDSSEYAARVLLFSYISWFKESHLEKGGDNLYQYLLSVVEEKVKDPAMQQQGYLLVFSDLFSQGDTFGEAETVYKRGLQLLTDPEQRAKLTEEYTAFQKIQPGAPAVDCEWSDAEGNISRFSDLIGKVIYLDVWATTCRPCCAEIPYMASLAAYFKNDPRIEIVSVSVDDKRQAWLNKLEQEKPQWKQFWKEDFCQLYNIDMIPRFLLFDSQGKIITLDAPRPSDPEIKTFISKYLN